MRRIGLLAIVNCMKIASGRLLKKWDGDLEAKRSKRPVWTQHLTH